MRYGNVEIKKQTQIFVTVSYYFRMQEYRKKLLMSKQISDDIKQFSYEICQKHKEIYRAGTAQINACGDSRLRGR